MTSKPQYRALFFGAGDEMQCGVGQFTRLLGETIEKIDPGSSTTLTLTRAARVSRRHLARRRLGAKRGLQFPDRGLETGDLPSATGAGDGAAAAAQDCPDSARMGRAALAAPDHLHSGAVARRYHRDVLAAGAARTRRRPRGRRDRQENACWRRCRRTSQLRPESRTPKLRQRLAAARDERAGW